jgi:hypothetical protein
MRRQGPVNVKGRSNFRVNSLWRFAGEAIDDCRRRYRTAALRALP